MKRVMLFSFVLLAMFALSACARQYAACNATVVSFVFQEDDIVGYTPTGAKLLTEAGDEILIFFKDFRPQKIEIDGSLNILAGTGGVSVSPGEGYRLTFSMENDSQIVLQKGVSIRLIEIKENHWVPSIP